jgi:hypothetical protein
MRKPLLRSEAIRTLAFFLALLATAVALGGALAHLFELPNKIGLPRDAYFTVQSIYRGWSRLAWVLLVQLVSIVVVIVLYRRQPNVLRLALLALLGLVAAQAIFWVWTYPANVATDNWSRIPENWQELRRRWEYSHAAGAGMQLVAMCALILAALRTGRG